MSSGEERLDEMLKQLNTASGNRNQTEKPHSALEALKSMEQREAEEQARAQREAEEQARAQREAEEQARAQREAEEQARAQREAEEQARAQREAEEQALTQLEAEEEGTAQQIPDSLQDEVETEVEEKEAAAQEIAEPAHREHHRIDRTDEEPAVPMEDMVDQLEREDSESDHYMAEDIQDLSEEEINHLLTGNRRRTAKSIPGREKALAPEELEEILKADSSSIDEAMDDDEDLSDIKRLLEKSDNHELLEESDHFGEEKQGNVRRKRASYSEDDTEKRSSDTKNAKKSGGMFASFQKLLGGKKDKKAKNQETASAKDHTDENPVKKSSAGEDNKRKDLEKPNLEKDNRGNKEDGIEDSIEEKSTEENSTEGRGNENAGYDTPIDILAESDLVPEKEEVDQSAADALLHDLNDAAGEEVPGKKTSRRKKGEAAGESADEAEGQGKKKSLLKRILEALFYDEDETAQQNAAVMDSAEEPGSEDTDKAAKKGRGKAAKKAKPKKGKKAAKGKAAAETGEESEEDAEDNAEQGGKKKKAGKGKKPGKEKKAAKEKKPAEEDTSKKIPRRQKLIVAIFAITLAVILLLVNTVGIHYIELNDARIAYQNADYQTAYEMYSGKDLNESDSIQYQRARATLQMQNKLTAYDAHIRLGKKVLALNDLIEGVALYQKDEQNTTIDLITAELKKAYEQILGILMQSFHLSENDAQAIANDNDDYTYSLRIEAVVEGKPFTDPTKKPDTATDNTSQEDTNGSNN